MRKIIASASLALALLALAASTPATAFDYSAERGALMKRLAAIERGEGGLSEADRLQAFIDLQFEYVMLEYPEFATYIGHPVGHDRWTDGSFEAEARRDQDAENALRVLRSIGRSALEGEDRLNYDLLLQNLEDTVTGARFPGELMPINQMGGSQQNIAQMFAIMPKGSVRDYENILARFDGASRVVEDEIAHLERGLAASVTPPKITMRDVPQQIENLLPEDPWQSALLAPFVQFPDSIPAADQERMKNEALAVYSDHLAPTYRKLHDYMVETYIPGCRESIAMAALPDGEAWYAFNVRQMTTTDMTPSEIHELGLSEVRRIRGEMDKVIAEAGYEGRFDDFTKFLRTDPQFYFTKASDLLTGYRDIAKRVDAELPRFFGTLPRLTYGVTPVPSYAEKSQTTAYYQGGSLEGGRAGQFFANTYALDTRPKWEMEALTLHEAVPGHHLQISIQQELDMPWFRRFGGETAFVEGWGLYSESLGGEMGFYQDPYSKFGQLTYEMWRAVRLVVDTGMHSLGWSRQQAIDYFVANSGKTEHDIVVEIDRYIVWPGQALAYKIGELKIKEIKARAQAELGDAFDIRTFHDAILRNGALPLSVLEGYMDDWISEQKM
jgi:uncharacterized protein (DUF885 family)